MKHATPLPCTVGKQKYFDGTAGTPGNDAVVGSNLLADDFG
jgi:hypothetical protein